jgi:hypothetical protein
MATQRITLNASQSRRLSEIAQKNNSSTTELLDRICDLLENRNFSEISELIESQGQVKRRKPKEEQFEQITRELECYLTKRLDFKEKTKGLELFTPRKLRSIGQNIVNEECGTKERSVATLARYIELTDWLKHIDPNSKEVELELIEAFQKQGLLQVDS